METALVRYDAMCRAIAESYEVDEVKQIRDQAIALEHYSRLAHNVEAESQCCRIRLRAERKAGELLKQMEKNKGAQGTGSNQYQQVPSDDARAPKTLSDLGISYDQSSQWQRLADVPEEQFELAVSADKPTTAGIINSAKAPEQVPVDRAALWLWGRLRDFAREGYLDKPVADVLLTMTPHMLDDIYQLAPRVAFWLHQIGGMYDGTDST